MIRSRRDQVAIGVSLALGAGNIMVMWEVGAYAMICVIGFGLLCASAAARALDV